VVEGAKVLGEALAAGALVESVYVDRTALGPDDPLEGLLDRAHAAGSRIYDLEAGVLSRVADTVTPQPVVAIVAQMDVPLGRLGELGADLVVVCVDVRDPGNAGTVLRSAEASGASGVVCCDGSVDMFNPKTVRASAGALFHVPVVSGGNAVQVLEQCGKWGLRRLATTARGGRDYALTDLSTPIAVVLGNEANGLPAGLDQVLDEEVSIPMAGRTESINVGMAAAVMCFEAARQRRLTDSGRAPIVGAVAEGRRS
jgi:TrmH family RNA methyltransferase